MDHPGKCTSILCFNGDAEAIIFYGDEGVLEHIFIGRGGDNLR